MSSRVALDTNLFVLFVVGSANPAYIDSHRRLRDYRMLDYQLLQTMLADFAEMIFTPNVLTESSNLLRQIGDPIKSECVEMLARIISDVPEIYVPSATACRDIRFGRLGLTDVVLLEACRQGAALLTADHNLHIAALTEGLTSVNFNNERDFG